MEPQLKPQVLICTDCKASVSLPPETQVGDIIECPECGTEMEITSLEPLSYRELFEEK